MLIKRYVRKFCCINGVRAFCILVLVCSIGMDANISTAKAEADAPNGYYELLGRFNSAANNDEKCLYGQAFLKMYALNFQPTDEQFVIDETTRIGCPFQRDALKKGEYKEVNHEELALNLRSLGGVKVKVKATVSCIIEVDDCALYPLGAGGLRKAIYLNVNFLDASVRANLYRECRPESGGCSVEVTGIVASSEFARSTSGDINVSEIVFTH